MASQPKLSQERATFPNADKVQELIESESDPVVRSLMRLVYGEFVTAVLRGRQPEGSVDLLYCFERIQEAFRRKDALDNALKGEYGDPDADLEWT
ncbi:MAG: hypothetical protein ACREJB_12540 [Planctomycetaceae bacterium]